MIAAQTATWRRERLLGSGRAERGKSRGKMPHCAGLPHDAVASQTVLARNQVFEYFDQIICVARK
jgi:hypothetical protein